MPAHRSSVFALVAFTLGSLPVAAQESRTVDVTPYVGVGTAGSSPLGVAVTFPVTSKLSFETDVAYRRGEGNINALSSNASVLWLLPRLGRSTPYAAAGIGLAQYGAPVFSSSGVPIGTARDVAVTLSAGGGVTTPINSKIDLRSDARWFNSLGTGSEQFRVAQGLSLHVPKR